VSAAARPQLTVIENPLAGFDGELTEENLRGLAQRVTALHDEARGLRTDLEVEKKAGKMAERDLKAKRLRIAELEADREEKALASPERPQVEALHACWKAGTGRATPLHFSDRERMGAAVKKLGFGVCLKAIAGVSFDPRRSDPMRNGKRQTYDSLELVFRTYRKVEEFAERAPAAWAPRPERVAEVAGVEVERVEGWLRIGEVEG
jgi:hypothetical protein